MALKDIEVGTAMNYTDRNKRSKINRAYLPDQRRDHGSCLYQVSFMKFHPDTTFSAYYTYLHRSPAAS